MTPKQNIRVPADRWQATIKRANTVHHTDATKVINAFLAEYTAGTLDDAVALWLLAPPGEQTGQEPSAESA